MRPITRAVAVAALQVVLICSLGLKLLHDRQTCPQAWFKTRPYDPNLPIRGRYLSLQVEVADPRSAAETAAKFRNEIQAQENARKQFASLGPFTFGQECGSIVVNDGVPEAKFEAHGPSGLCENLSFSRQRAADGSTTALVLGEPVIFFIPDTSELSTRRQNGSELWVLATIPREGPPRAIVLGVKKAGETTIERLKVD